MLMDRVILHCDMNGFFASVELLERPDLRDVPMAVCGNADTRHGVILAKNEAAKAYGVVTAETLWQARKKCPSLVTVPPHHDRYREYSARINEIYQRYTDLVEPFSIDESWLDVTASAGLFGSGREIADDIRKTVREELGLTLSAGVSFNKIFAKMGSEYKKPDATTVISRDNYREILWPLPVSEMFFCGSKTADKLIKYGIRTIGDLAVADPVMLQNLLGKHGAQLHIYANGLDDAPVSHYTDRRQVKSVGHGNTFAHNLTETDDIHDECMTLCDEVAVRLRRHQLKATGVKLDIKDEYLRVISRQKKLTAPTNLASELFHYATEIFHSSWQQGRPVRMITVTAIGLVPENESVQLSLFDSPGKASGRDEDLERTMDRIREKFGKDAISFGKSKCRR